MELCPYLMFNGNCEEALNFYAKALDGEVKNLSRFEGSPVETKPEDKQKVMHANFEAGDIKFMASDGGDGAKGNSIHLSVNVEDPKQLDKVFNAMSAGGKVTMPLQDTFWGARFGMLQDKFGMNWMFNCEKEST